MTKRTCRCDKLAGTVSSLWEIHDFMIGRFGRVLIALSSSGLLAGCDRGQMGFAGSMIPDPRDGGDAAAPRDGSQDAAAPEGGAESGPAREPESGADASDIGANGEACASDCGAVGVT